MIPVAMAGFAWSTRLRFIAGTLRSESEVRGTLRFLPQLEMRPSSNAPNPVECREARPTSSFPDFSEPPKPAVDIARQQEAGHGAEHAAERRPERAPPQAEERARGHRQHGAREEDQAGDGMDREEEERR